MVQVITRCLNLLEVLPEKEEGFGVLELAKRINLPGSTVHRILNALKKEGYIRQNPETEKYRVGYKILSLAGRMLENQSLKKIARPHLQKLKDSTGETTHLVILEGKNAVCIESFESSSNMRICSPIGENNPLHCTAVGKTILANLPAAEQKKLLAKRLKQYTGNTIISLKKLEAELRIVKERGCAFDREEYQQGVMCVAAPIKNSAGRGIAGVGISFPVFRADKRKEEAFIEGVKETARRISTEYSGN